MHEFPALNTRKAITNVLSSKSCRHEWLYCLKLFVLFTYTYPTVAISSRWLSVEPYFLHTF